MSRNTTKAPETSTQTWDGLSESHVEAYRAASDAKGRANVRAEVKSNLEAALMLVSQGDPTGAPQAGYWFRTQSELSTDTKPAKVEVPVEVSIAQRIMTLRAAADLLASGEVAPEGIESVDSDALAEAMTSVEVNGESARKLAGSKITRSTVTHSIQDVLERAFDGQPSGTVMRISDVARAGALDDYKPGGGAIRARFDKATERDGFRLVPANVATGEPVSIAKV